jgi:hypothetical protein
MLRVNGDSDMHGADNPLFTFQNLHEIAIFIEKHAGNVARPIIADALF